MNQDDLRKLRLDRRLLNRRGWVDLKALDSELQNLPDVSDKAESEEVSGDFGAADGSRATGDVAAVDAPPSDGAGPFPLPEGHGD